jgi:hypothetical protein
MSIHPRQSPIGLAKAPKQYDEHNEGLTRRQMEQALKTINERLNVLEKVIENQQAVIADPAGGATIDAEARTAIIAILTALRAHGLIET